MSRVIRSEDDLKQLWMELKELWKVFWRKIKK